MNGFREYEAKPVKRLAYELTEDDVIRQGDEPTLYRLGLGVGTLTFRAYEAPKPGDFVVYLTKDDVYHCRRDVFLERNIVD